MGEKDNWDNCIKEAKAWEDYKEYQFKMREYRPLTIERWGKALAEGICTDYVLSAREGLKEELGYEIEMGMSKESLYDIINKWFNIGASEKKR